MARTHVRGRIALTTLAVGLGAVLAGPVAGAVSAREGTEGVAVHRYVVREGDTVWAIAERLAGDEDPRALVDQIASANAIDPGHLVPGQALVIPMGT